MSFVSYSDGDFSDQVLRIVVVGGWSPGPLLHLKQALSLQGCQEIIEPQNLDQYMPPFPGHWCCHPAVVLMATILVAILYFVATLNTIFVLRLLILSLALAWCRLLAVVVVRTSIETSIRKIHRQGLNDDINHKQILVIGFSWGGHLVAEMIARGLVGGVNQSSALLIAPTTSLVAKVALEEDAASKIAKLGLAPNPTKITVVHGEYDRAFCPHQNRWNGISGVDLHILPDNHIFMTSYSLRELKRILLRYIQ